MFFAVGLFQTNMFPDVWRLEFVLDASPWMPVWCIKKECCTRPCYDWDDISTTCFQPWYHDRFSSLHNLLYFLCLNLRGLCRDAAKAVSLDCQRACDSRTDSLWTETLQVAAVLTFSVETELINLPKYHWKVSIAKCSCLIKLTFVLTSKRQFPDRRTWLFETDPSKSHIILQVVWFLISKHPVNIIVFEYHWVDKTNNLSSSLQTVELPWRPRSRSCTLTLEAERVSRSQWPDNILLSWEWKQLQCEH